MHSTKGTRKREKGRKKEKYYMNRAKIIIIKKNVREEHGFAANWGKPYKSKKKKSYIATKKRQNEKREKERKRKKEKESKKERENNIKSSYGAFQQAHLQK